MIRVFMPGKVEHWPFGPTLKEQHEEADERERQLAEGTKHIKVSDIGLPLPLPAAEEQKASSSEGAGTPKPVAGDSDLEAVIRSYFGLPIKLTEETTKIVSSSSRRWGGKAPRPS